MTIKSNNIYDADVVWIKNEANNELGADEFLDIAHRRILRVLSRLNLNDWINQVEKCEKTLPHLENLYSIASQVETKSLRLGHSYLYRTKYQQMNVWALAIPTERGGLLIQAIRDTEFLPILGPCLDSLLRFFMGEALSVARATARLR